MAYLVFARKWRPQTFEDVVGQEHITDTLKRAIEKDRVAHAYIFSGTRGVGKTTTARILARALNCNEGPTPTPCGVCESCKSIFAGNSFDVMEIDGASNNSVEDIRDLRENIGYTAMGGKYRIIVIDEVHMLSTSAFNALLKTLEEPPEKVIFILATTEPHKILDTVHSRCQRFDFRAISVGPIMAQLERICVSEGISFDKRSLELVAEKAHGSMRDALSLLDQAYSFCGETLQEERVRSVLGLVDTHVYRAVMQAIKAGSTADVIAQLDATLRRGYDVEEFLAGLLDYLRTLLFLAIPGGVSSLSKELEPQYREVSSQFSEGDLIRFCEMTAVAEKDLRFSSLPRFVVERLLVKMAYMDRTITVDQLIAMAEQKGGGLGTLPAHMSPQKVSQNPMERPTVSLPIVEMPPVTPSPIAPREIVAEIVKPPEPLAVKEEPLPIVEAQKLVQSMSEAPVVTMPEPAQPASKEISSVAVIETTTQSRHPVAQWDHFLEGLKSRRYLLSMQLQFGKPSADGTTLTLTLPHGKNFVEEQLALDYRTIEEELCNFAGTPWRFKVCCAEEEHHALAAEDEILVTEQPSQAPVVGTADFEEDVLQEPILQTVKDLFNGELLS